jgi:hypothetical protein
MTRATVVAALALVASACVFAQQPAVLMIEDFEGPETWGGVTLDGTDPREGEFCGVWIPKSTSTLRDESIPHDWSGYDVLSFWLHSEKANGQRLTLVCNSENEADGDGWDYFFYHFEVDWSGWKLFSLRLGEDIRGTRKPIGWNQIDYLSFNSGGWDHHALEDTVLRLDAVMLVREPAALRQSERRVSSEGDALVVTIEFEVTNRTDEARTFPMRTEGEFVAFTPSLTADRTPEIPSGGTATVVVTLTADAADLAGAEPLTREEGRLVMDTDIEGLPPLQATIAAATPLPKRERPLLFTSQDEIDRALQRAEQHEWARASLDSIISTADKALAIEVAVPDEGGQWGHHYVCKKCGVSLKTKSPTEHVCPRCGEVYTGWPWDQVVVARDHHRLTRAIRDLGLGYGFTRNVDYARKAREILLAYGDRYADFPYHDTRGNESRSGGRLYAQTLDESVDIIQVCWGYDLIYDSGVFSDEDRALIEDGYLREVARTIMRHDARMSNWQTWHNAGVAAIGFCLRDEDLASHAINGAHGLRYQFRASVLPEGFWYEGTAAYHFYALSAMRWTVEAARHSGVDFYSDPVYKSLYDAPLQYVFPDLKFPAVNDSDTFSLTGQRALYEIAYAHFGDEAYLNVLSGKRSGLEALLWGADELPSAVGLELPSRDFEGLGAAVMRSGSGDDQVYLHLAGRLAYGAPLHGQWYRQTIAHNTLTVDGVSQRPTEGRLTLFHDGEAAKIMRAECDTAYDGVAMRRTTLLADGYLIDIFEVASEDQHTYDWAWHNIERFQERPLGSAPAEPLADGNGYQHIADMQRADGATDWDAEFAVEDAGGARLIMLGEAGTEVYSGEGLLGRSVARCPMVIARRECANTTFISVVNWWKQGDGPSVESLEFVPVTSGGGELGPDEALGLRLIKADGEDLLLLAPDALGEKTIEGVMTEAGLLFVSRTGGEVTGIEHVDITRQ